MRLVMPADSADVQVRHECCDHCVVVGNPHHPAAANDHTFPCRIGCAT